MSAQEADRFMKTEEYGDMVGGYGFYEAIFRAIATLRRAHSEIAMGW